MSNRVRTILITATRPARLNTVIIRRGPAGTGSGEGGTDLTTYEQVSGLPDYPPFFPPESHDHAGDPLNPTEILIGTANGAYVALTSNGLVFRVLTSPGVYRTFAILAPLSPAGTGDNRELRMPDDISGIAATLADIAGALGNFAGTPNITTIGTLSALALADASVTMDAASRTNFFAAMGFTATGKSLAQAATPAAACGALGWSALIGEIANSTNLLSSLPSIGTGWTHSAGTFTSDSGNSTGYNGLTWTAPDVVSGGVYLLRFRCTARTSGSLQIFTAGQTAFSPTSLTHSSFGSIANWDFACIIIPNSNYGTNWKYLNIRCNNGFVGAISNVSLIKIL